MASTDREELILVVFATDDIIGQHPEAMALPQGFTSVVAREDALECVTMLPAPEDDEVEIGHGSYLVTATLQCLGLGVEPGGSVAFLRLSTYGQASIVYHQAGPDAPVPPDARETAVVAGWQGTGWTEPIWLRDAPDDRPPTDWPINAALRRLGVDRGHYPDEITALGLPLTIPPGPGRA